MQNDFRDGEVVPRFLEDLACSRTETLVGLVRLGPPSGCVCQTSDCSSGSDYLAHQIVRSSKKHDLRREGGLVMCSGNLRASDCKHLAGQREFEFDQTLSKTIDFASS